MTHPRTQAPPATGDIAGRFVFRPATLEADLPPLVALLNATEAVDQTDRGTTADELRLRLTVPDYALARDGWVVEEPGHPDRLIAQSAMVKEANADRAFIGITVHPAWRRQGLGGELLARGIARAREKGVPYVTAGTNARMPAGAVLLAGRGFHPVSTWVHLRTSAGLPIPDPVWPGGYTVRAYAAVAHLPTLLTALNRGFIGHHEQHDDTEEGLAHWLQAPGTRPEGIFLAFGPAGDVAGVCWADINPARNARRGIPTGYIDSLAVVPEHRRQGLGRALLLHGMAWLRAHDQTLIELSAWGENTMALPLYYGAGFALAQQGTQYRLDLPR